MLCKHNLWLPFGFEVLGDEDFEKKCPDIIKAYREVFGKSDPWGEGGVCAKCEYVVDLDAYEASSSCPKCGSHLNAFHLPEQVKSRMIGDLLAANGKAVVATMQGSTHTVAAFMWATIAPWAVVSKRIQLARYSRNYHQGARDLQMVSDILKERGIGDETPLLYGNEVGIISAYRQGLLPILTMTRIWLEHGRAFGVERAFFWTSKGGKAHKLTQLTGFEDLYESEDGIVFVYLANSGPLLDIMRSSSPEQFTQFLARST